MWRIRIVVPVIVMLFMGCGGDKPAQSSSNLDSRTAKRNYIILRVQGMVYFNSDFERYLKLSLGDEHNNLPDLSLSRLVDSFVEEKLLFAAARDQEIELTLEEKRKFLVKHTNGSATESGQWPVDDEGADALFEQVLVEKYTYSLIQNIRAEAGEIRDYYLEHKRDFLLPERVKVSQILLPNEEKAVEILEKLANAGPESFKELAKTQSIGAEASRGGEMGVFAMGQLPEEMETVIFALEEGQVSPVLESSYGFHIFRLDSRYEPELVSPDQAANSIELIILGQKVKNHISQHIEDLKNTLEWAFYPQNLYFPYQRISDE